METVGTPSFAALLKQYRLSSGHTQETLAGDAHLSARCISDLERGIKRAPRHDTVELLADALRLSDAERTTFAATARAHTPRTTGSQTRPHAVHSGDALPPLVGRVADLVAIQHFLQSGPPALFVTGEPGIGKTRLLREAAEYASGAGWRVLSGGTQRLGRLVPYAPLVGALCRYLTQRTPAQQREDLRGCGWLVRLLPELTDVPGMPAPEWKMPPEQERRLMFAATARLLDNVAGPAGTLLVLDDLQWAGPDALDLLVTLARGALDGSLHILCAYRDTDVLASDPLAAALADLAHAGVARQLRLGPLAAPEASALLRNLLPEKQATALVGEVLEQSGGVPFFLVSWAQALRALGTEIDCRPAVPWNVAQSVGQRVAALPPIARELLGAAAVIGRRASRPLLLALAARGSYGEAAVIDALDATVQARMLVEVGADSYQFAHDLIREVVIGGLSAARRSVLHRHVAEAIEAIETGGDEARAAVLAYHFAQAGEDDKTLHYLERAGDRAAEMQACGAAVSYYRDLIARLDTRAQSLRAARIREKLGTVLMAAAQYSAALDVFEEAIATYRAAGDLEGICRATAQIGWVHALNGTASEGIARLQPLPEPLNTSRLSSLGLAQLYVALAQLYSVSGRYADQLQMAERATKLAAATRDTALLARAEMRYGTALLMVGRLEEGFRVLEGAIPSIEAAGDLRNLCWAINNIGAVYEERGEFTTARHYAARAVELAERLADPAVLAFMVRRRGINAFCAGDWERARMDLERALELIQGVATSAVSAYPPLGVGQLSLACGEHTAAERYLARAEALARPRHDLQALYLIQSLLAERDLLAGRAGAARDRLLPFLGEQATDRANVAILLPRLAWAYVELGELERADEIVRQAVTEAMAQRNRLHLVEGLTVRALLESRRRDDGAAARTLDAALALTRDMCYPYGEARVLFAFGYVYARQGQRERARVHIDAALAILRRLGERLYAERAEALLAAVTPAPVHAR